MGASQADDLCLLSWRRDAPRHLRGRDDEQWRQLLRGGAEHLGGAGRQGNRPGEVQFQRDHYHADAERGQHWCQDD